MSGQLERLLEQATPWEGPDGSYGTGQSGRHHARLIALAPDLARLLVDAMALVAEHVRKEDAEYEFMGLNAGVCDCDACADSRALLARFAELEQRAGEGQA